LFLKKFVLTYGSHKWFGLILIAFMLKSGHNKGRIKATVQLEDN